MRRQRSLVLAVLIGALLVPGAPAFADITGFLGVSGGPSARVTKGLAVGAGLLMFGWEVEYGDTSSDVVRGSPRIQTGMVNALVQTPIGVRGLQVYGTGGVGVYHEELVGDSRTNVGINLGGGVKKTLVGPLRLRVDYRVFHLSGSPFGDSLVHRFYVAANVKF
jgi:opacity protein-like surface antigen